MGELLPLPTPSSAGARTRRTRGCAPPTPGGVAPEHLDQPVLGHRSRPGEGQDLEDLAWLDAADCDPTTSVVLLRTVVVPKSVMSNIVTPAWCPSRSLPARDLVNFGHRADAGSRRKGVPTLHLTGPDRVYRGGRTADPGVVPGLRRRPARCRPPVDAGPPGPVAWCAARPEQVSAPSRSPPGSACGGVADGSDGGRVLPAAGCESNVIEMAHDRPGRSPGARAHRHREVRGVRAGQRAERQRRRAGVGEGHRLGGDRPGLDVAEGQGRVFDVITERAGAGQRDGGCRCSRSFDRTVRVAVAAPVAVGLKVTPPGTTASG